LAGRRIVAIDRGACNGCGNCTTACAEGALALDADGKAVLVRDIYCDGLGACLDVCPTGALKVEEREGDAYDPKRTYRHVLETRGRAAAAKIHGAGPSSSGREGSGCPGSRARTIEVDACVGQGTSGSVKSQLSQWPIQLHLVSPLAPYFDGCDLLVAADCTAFALGGFHQDLLKGKRLIIACPKLDETRGYAEKLADIIRRNHLHSLTVAIMTVPCCTGLQRLVEQAVELSGERIPLDTVVIGIDGRVVPSA
jgi:Fe-S-cluster-containing hydrogenase component 2